MSSAHLSRRQLLTLLLAWSFAPARALALEGPRQTGYEVEVGILYRALRYRLTGVVDERVDPDAGRYEVTVTGQGTGFAHRGQSSGMLREGRWVPLSSSSWIRIAGREGQGEISYDYERRAAQYRSRSETFFLGRVRVVDDVVALPAGARIDDTISAILNHTEGRWPPGPSGLLETSMVRRRRDEEEGQADVAGQHRAEIIPVVLRPVSKGTGGPSAVLFDLTRFSSWALPDQPAEIVFGADRRPRVISARLMYGSSFTIRFADA